MKSKLVFMFLLGTIFLFLGCYTVLLVEDSTENASVEPASITQPALEYIQVYYPNSVPEHIPQPPQYLLPATYVSDSPSSTPPNSNDRRPIQTGRGPAISNPAPTRNDNNNNGTRDSGVQRGKR
ncbi:MAG: hypothetical protein ABSA44_02695 [Bacteroidota bacterium]|jgi:hypothetical protein